MAAGVVGLLLPSLLPGTTAFVLAQVAVTAIVGLGVSFLVNALTPNPESSYQTTAIGTALDHQIIYGKARVYGVRVFDAVGGTDNEYLHRVVAFAGHEIEEFSEIYINDALVTSFDVDGNVATISSDDPDQAADIYDGYIRIKEHLGASDQAADNDLVSEVADWTTEHRLRGIAYLYIRMKYDQDVFPNGIVEVSATIKGKKVYNPSTDTTAWSDNSALCIRDYLTSKYGLEEADANIDDSLVTSAATVCDETDTLGGETRYTCNGAFTTGAVPYDIVRSLLSSMGGMLWYSQGKWRMKPAYWTATVEDFEEDDLRSGISISTRHSRRDNFNTVSGTFRGAESNWQETDYPPVASTSYIIADNGQESVFDFPLKYTDTSVEARRLARIFLEKNRQQLTVEANFGLKAFNVQVGDNVTLSLDRFGWTSKEFEVIEWSFGMYDGDLQCKLILRETAETIYDEVDDGEVYERDNTTLPSPYLVPSVGITTTAFAQIISEKLLNSLRIDVSSGSPERIDYVELRELLIPLV